MISFAVFLLVIVNFFIWGTFFKDTGLTDKLANLDQVQESNTEKANPSDDGTAERENTQNNKANMADKAEKKESTTPGTFEVLDIK